MDPREALTELLLNYRDQATHLVRADNYFRAEPSSVSLGPRIPPALARFRVAWPAVRIATNAFADRVSLEDIHFENEDAQDRVSEFRDSYASALTQAILESLATGIGYIRIVVLDNGTLTYSATRGRDGAFIEDPDTGEILATMRVHRPRRHKGPVDNPRNVTVYTRGGSTQFTMERRPLQGDTWFQYETVTLPKDVLLMRPLLNRARASEPYGRAEARDLYSVQDMGSRTLTDLSVATDALAVPQRALVAALPESISELSQVKAYTDSILALSGDVRLEEWAAAQLAPFVETLNSHGRTASSISGIPLSYWGLSSEANQASGDAIRENDARLEIRARQLGSQWTSSVKSQVSDIATLLKFGDVGAVSVTWADPSTPTPAAAADAAIKLAQIGPVQGQVVVDRDMIWDVLRVPPADRERMRSQTEVDSINQLLNGGPGETDTGTNSPGTSNEGSGP